MEKRADLRAKIFALKDKLASTRRQVEERDRRILDFEARLAGAEKERDDLRRQLSQIREAHEPLHEAIYPDLLKRAVPSFGAAWGSLPAIAMGAADLFPQHQKGQERC